MGLSWGGRVWSCISVPLNSSGKILGVFLFFGFWVFFGHGMQWLDVGSLFLDKGLNLGSSGESAKS